jgi:hypothetical protein
MKTETARKAAKWWSKFLDAPVILDNGDQSGTGFMASALAGLAQDISRAKLPDDAPKKFEDALTGLLEAKTDEWLCIGVDYHPDTILDNAAEEAGFSLGMTLLPWKTTMWIMGDKITVRNGYHAESEELK